MKPYVLLDKRIGQTPLEAIQEWKAAHPGYANVPASYAGRLDPMASGKLLVLLGEECKRQKEYTKLDKEYEVEVLLDVGSDTGDILGIVETGEKGQKIESGKITEILEAEVGMKEVEYPVYSSKTVDGKPLFLYALEGTLGSIEIPKHHETIYSIELQDVHQLSSLELKERIASLLALAPVSTEPSKALGADFRIAAVRESWEKALEEERDYQVLKLHVSCASGTYMRSLAGRIGTDLGTRALALSIHRTRINGLGLSRFLRRFLTVRP